MEVPNDYAERLLKKAKKTSDGKDWAEYAAYLEGENKINEAYSAWEKAITLTPFVPRRFKAERPRQRYRNNLRRMLKKNKMYEEQIKIEKAALKEETDDYSKRRHYKEIASAYLRLDEKDEALQFLFEQLDKKFDPETTFIILQTDYGKTPDRYYSLNKDEVQGLSSWGKIIDRAKALNEPDRSESLAEIYHQFMMYKEYTVLVEALPEERINKNKISRLIESNYYLNNNKKAVYWAMQALKQTGQKDYFIKGGDEYRGLLAAICTNSARAGDFKTSIEYAKKLLIYNPENIHFILELAKLAKKQNKQQKLLSQLKQFATEHPTVWSAWRCLAKIYEKWGNQEQKELCLQKMKKLK